MVCAVRHRFAISDRSVPTFARIRAAIDSIYASIAGGDPAYVHCFAGIGRTRTVVGCPLREQGMSYDGVIALTDRKWQVVAKRRCYPRSPEQPEQFEFIDARIG